MSWPEVVLPNFSSLARRVVEMTGALRIIMAVVVEDDQRQGFELHLAENLPSIIEDTINYQGLNATIDDIKGIPSEIMAFNLSTRTKARETKPGPYLVQTQRYPFRLQEPVFQGNNVLAPPANREGFRVSNITKAPSLSFANIVDGVRGQIFQPVLSEGETGDIVGVLWLHTLWESVFSNLVSPDAKGLHFVVTSSCGFVVTFEINGITAVSLGLEDLHERKYDDMFVESELANIPVAESIQLEHDFCADVIKLRIYPSDKFREVYISSEPVFFASVVVVIFAVTFSLFVTYDFAVNRRQIRLASRLNKQEKLVSDVFPKEIMSRLIQDSSDSGEATQTSRACDEGRRKKKDIPLADLYPECTVMYADIQGFVAWSSQRQPHEVFKFLETIHQEFDRVSCLHTKRQEEFLTICTTFFAACTPTKYIQGRRCR